MRMTRSPFAHGLQMVRASMTTRVVDLEIPLNHVARGCGKMGKPVPMTGYGIEKYGR